MPLSPDILKFNISNNIVTENNLSQLYNEILKYALNCYTATPASVEIYANGEVLIKYYDSIGNIRVDLPTIFHEMKPAEYKEIEKSLASIHNNEKVLVLSRYSESKFHYQFVTLNIDNIKNILLLLEYAITVCILSPDFILNSKIEQSKKQVFKCLSALYIELDTDIADDIYTKVSELIHLLENK